MLCSSFRAELLPYSPLCQGLNPFTRVVQSRESRTLWLAARQACAIERPCHVAVRQTLYGRLSLIQRSTPSRELSSLQPLAFSCAVKTAQAQTSCEYVNKSRLLRQDGDLTTSRMFFRGFFLNFRADALKN